VLSQKVENAAQVINKEMNSEEEVFKTLKSICFNFCLKRFSLAIFFGKKDITESFYFYSTCPLKWETHYKKNKYYLSIYENDSIDKTIEILNNFDFSFFEDYKIKHENLNKPFFSRTMNEDRVKLLSESRNKSIYNNKFLEQCSHVLVVEPDINYDPKILIDNIINIGDYDIISPRSVDIDKSPPCYLYDDWATRKTSNDLTWKIFNKNILRNLSLVSVWSTFNCFCLYKAEPFKRFLTFGYFNERFNRFDCDTAVVCENFRKYGYSNIVLNSSVEVYHSLRFT